MGSPQDNLWRSSLDSLHITALYLWSDLWGLPPRCPLEEVVKAGAQGLQPLQPPEDQSFFSSHGTSYHVDSPAMFFVNSCWGKIDNSSKQESVVSSHHPLNKSYSLLWGDFLHRIHGMRRVTQTMIVQQEDYSDTFFTKRPCCTTYCLYLSPQRMWCGHAAEIQILTSEWICGNCERPHHSLAFSKTAISALYSEITSA